MDKFQKNKRIRLHGRALAALNAEVHDRDDSQCIICRKGVRPGEKAHHFLQGKDKTDRIECMAILCMKCHFEAHFGDVREMKRAVEDYLRGRYPDYWEGK